MSIEKFHMMMSEGLVLGHFISSAGVQVDPAKIKVISNIPIPGFQKEVRSLLGHVGYYRRFIDFFFQIGISLIYFANERCPICVDRCMPSRIFRTKEEAI